MEAIDEYLEREDQNFTKKVQWLLDSLPIVKSPHELVLAYIYGILMNHCLRIVWMEKVHKRRKVTDVTTKEQNEIRKMLKHRIQAFLEKINIELGM